MAYYKEVQCTVVSETKRSDSGGTWVEYGGMRSDMKKKGMVLFLTGLLGMSLFLGGCTSKSEKKALEYKQLGISQMKEAKYEDAVSSFQKALDQSLGRIRAQELDVCYYKALAQYKSGDTKAAIKTYDGLVDYDKKNWEVYYLRGSVLLADGQPDACLKDYDKAVSLNDSDAELYGHISENLQNAGRTQEAQKYLEQGLNKMLTQAADKGADRAYLALGKLYTSEKKMEDAKAAFQKYMEKHPKDADALEQLASIAADAGDYADAATYYKDAMEAASGDQVKELQKALVAVYEKNGDFASALEEAKDYVADYPEDETMQKEYEFLQTRGLTGLENTGTDNTQQADDTAADTTTEGNGQ